MAPRILVCKADGGEVTGGEIFVSAQIPRYGADDYVKKSHALYRAEGRVLADALEKNLPGGTLHALLVELLERKASLLRVPA